MNWILFRILKQSTWIVTGVRHCCIRDLPVIKSSQKNNASTWIQTSASALGSKQIIFSFKVFGRGETGTIQGQIVFLFYFFTFSLLTWLNSCVSRKPIKSMHSCKYFWHHFTLWIFMSWLWRRSMNLSNIIYFIQDLENTGKKRI